MIIVSNSDISESFCLAWIEIYKDPHAIYSQRLMQNNASDACMRNFDLLDRCKKDILFHSFITLLGTWDKGGWFVQSQTEQLSA